jgi:plasmid stabilization system protein ParE
MRKYIQDLFDYCQLLSAHPSMGRPSDSLAPGLRRFKTGKHVIFYLQKPDHIAVVRILHQQTLPAPESFN